MILLLLDGTKLNVSKYFSYMGTSSESYSPIEVYLTEDIGREEVRERMVEAGFEFKREKPSLIGDKDPSLEFEGDMSGDRARVLYRPQEYIEDIPSEAPGDFANDVTGVLEVQKKGMEDAARAILDNFDSVVYNPNDHFYVDYLDFEVDPEFVFGELPEFLS
jgi:hypothetical protein